MRLNLLLSARSRHWKLFSCLPCPDNCSAERREAKPDVADGFPRSGCSEVLGALFKLLKQCTFATRQRTDRTQDSDRVILDSVPFTKHTAFLTACICCTMPTQALLSSIMDKLLPANLSAYFAT